MKAIIVDDEQEARDVMTALLNEMGDIDIVDICENTKQAYEQIQVKQPDIVFADIQMPGENGIDLAKKVVKHQISNTAFIFVSAYDAYALDAFKVFAFDYLLKPVNRDELASTIARIKASKHNNDNDKRLDLLLERFSKKRIRFNTLEGYVLLDPDDIAWCEADKNYTEMKLTSGSKHILSMNLGKVEDFLPSYDFLRVNRSSLVNINYIHEIKRKSKMCILQYRDKKVELKIARNRLPLLMNVFNH